MCVWCRWLLEWLSDNVLQAFTTWLEKNWRACSRRKCKWWCACCNRWLCWLALVLIAIAGFALILIAYLIALLACWACFAVCIVLCVFFWIFQRTPLDNCINWCNSGRLEPWPTEPRVDPEDNRPKDPSLPSEGPLRRSVGMSYSDSPTITNLRQLEAIAGPGQMLRRPHAIRLALSGLSKPDLAKWEAAINANLRACGCIEGAVILLVSLAASTTYYFWSERSDLTWEFAGGAILISMLLAVFGKGVVLLRTQRNLGDLVKKMHVAGV
jgi:hypothetical protein